MKPLSAVTAPILAQLYADRTQSTDRITEGLRRLDDEARKTIDKLTTGNRPMQLTGKETT